MYGLKKTEPDPGNICVGIAPCVQRCCKQCWGRGAVRNRGVGAKGQQHRVEEGTDSEQCSILPRVALFASSGCGGVDRPATSPRGKLSVSGVPQPASHGRCLCAKDHSPGRPWAGVAERLASKRE